jgi:osmotically inducible protein OsmC
MPTRTARTSWNGGLKDGSGRVELQTSGVGTFDVSWPRRTEEAEGVTSPEELVAAAHSSCFSMAFSGELGRAGGTPTSLEVTAEVDFGPDPAGGFHISSIKLTVRGSAEGVDEATFLECAEKAKVGCPISKALASVPEITVDATFEG